jgi:hypothetical protein
MLICNNKKKIFVEILVDLSTSDNAITSKQYIGYSRYEMLYIKVTVVARTEGNQINSSVSVHEENLPLEACKFNIIHSSSI